MRFSLLFPLVWLTAVAPCRAGWGGPAATGLTGTGVAPSTTAPGYSSGARGNAPASVAPVSRGVIAAPTLGANINRAPVAVSRPAFVNNGVARPYSPITANARPVGIATAPRPVMNPNLPRAVRPTLPLPNPAPAPSRLATFTANADANRNRPNRPGGDLPRRPDRTRPVGPYISYPNSFSYGGRRPGHYVPGETYVQDTAGYGYNYPFGASPAYYLGGAFPYFYGGAVGTYGTALGVTPDAVAAPAPVSAAEPGPANTLAEEGAPAAGQSNRPARTPDLAGANSLVEAVQGELLRRGYFAGHPDGVFRADTGEALRRFQENHGLAGTGLVNEATLFALGLN